MRDFSAGLALISQRLSLPVIITLLSGSAACRAQSRIIRVLADFPTIQAALDNASTSSIDTVLVNPGVYNEPVSFGNKDVRLVSAAGPSVTSIEGPAASFALVSFGSVTTNALLCGFTLTNSNTGIWFSSLQGTPLIVSNVIVNCSAGVLINSGENSPTILSNRILSCTSQGIAVSAEGAPLIEGNFFQGNQEAISLSFVCLATIRNNTIRDTGGDAINMNGPWNAYIVQNQIFNSAGNGIAAFVGYDAPGPWILNNTIVGNGLASGEGIALTGYPANARILNNIVVGAYGIGCDGYAGSFPTLVCNDVFSRNGEAYVWPIIDQTGTNGNISADPYFVCEPSQDFHIAAGSPCIGAGTNVGPLLPATDFDGNPRIGTGQTNGAVAVDLGAFAFGGSSAPSPCPFLFCPSNMVVVAPAGQASAVVKYAAPFATPGAVVSNTPPSGSVFDAGNNTVAVSAAFGTNVLNCGFTITVLTASDFGVALNATNVGLATTGDSPWLVETAETHDGIAAAQSGAISNAQASILYTVLEGPGTLSFWWSVSSNPGHGVLSLVADGLTSAAISGSVGWEQQNVDLGPGTHLVEWIYSKDASPSVGSDAGWLDQVAYTGGAGPLRVYCPSNIAVTVPPGQLSVPVEYPAPLATPGATVTTSPASGSAFPLGETSVAVTASEGTNVDSCAFTVMILTTNDFGRALNATNLSWSTTGDSLWSVETAETHDGVAAAQSGLVSQGQSSSLYTALLGPGTLDFYWYEPDCLYGLALTIDGVTQESISCTSDWQRQTVEIGPGIHVAEWTVTVTGSGVWWQDVGWLDEVSYNGPAGSWGLYCPSNLTVVAPPGQPSATVNYIGPIATASSVTVATSHTSGSAFPVGDTTVSVVASDGTNTDSCAFTVTVLAWDDFARALGTTNLAWGTGGDVPWFVETAETYGGIAAAQSGGVSAGQASTLYTVLLGPGELSFWWAAASWWDRSFLSVKVNGVTNAATSPGLHPFWQSQQVDLGPGTHLVEWTFAMDPRGEPGPDAGWLAQVAYTGRAGPLSVFCPPDIAVMAAPGQASATVNYAAPLATPGATLTTSPTSGSAFPVGDTTVAVTAAEGTNVDSCAFTVSVLTTNDFTRALGATNITWMTSGEASWFVETAVTHDGLAAVQSGAITNDETSALQTTFIGPGVLTFWWEVSSAANHDFLSLVINGATNASISGDVDWQPQTVYLGSGTQLLEWTYSKGASGNAGWDAGWLDQVSYTPGPAAPLIIAQPASLAVAPGLTAAFSLTAAGTPPLSYQWRFNGQNIDGATNATLVISNVQASSFGTYSVLAANQVGTALSADATLTLTEVLAWGVDSFGQTNVPPNLTNVIAIAGGWHHSAAVKADGTVVAWGDNNAGQTNVPSNLTNAVAISSRSGDHIMALRADGRVVVWGDNSHGQTNVPAGLSNVVAIAAGGYQCLVLRADGTAVAWGYVPTVPAGLSNIVAIAAGRQRQPVSA